MTENCQNISSSRREAPVLPGLSGPEIIEGVAILAADPLLGIAFNRSQAKFIDAIKFPPPDRDTITLVPFLKPNGLGGSYSLVSAWAALMFGTRHPRCSGYPFGDKFPWVKSARLVGPIASLADEGPIQKAMRDLFPASGWTQGRGTGKSYFCEGRAGPWTWEFITSDQAVLQAAAQTHGLIMFTEPPPHDIYSESVTRLRGAGLVLIEMTQLNLAPWFEEIEDSDGLILDGKRVGGKPRIVWGDLEDACRDCNPPGSEFPGHRAHTAIEADVASWPADEREARRTGKRMRLSGRIYPTYGDHNEISEMPDYHQACWDSGDVRVACCIDPHDARPWCIAWFACFPNADVVAFAEWPNLDFRACKVSPVTDIEDYRNLIAETEATIGKPTVMRFMDSGHMYTPGKGSAKTLDIMLRGPCRGCLMSSGASLDDDDNSDAYQRASMACTHKLAFQGWPVYSGSVNHGHTLVRPYLGSATQRPKFFVMDCPNLRYGMKHYAYKLERNPEKAAAERASFVSKDWPDLVRGGYLMGWQDWPAETKPLAVNPVRTGAPADPRVSKPPERNWPVVRAKTKGLNINPVRLGGPANQDHRR